ncbi:hypothetical protein NDU88_008361 [Pleurodeles waltl]|uniref:Uncharacterized protein n=1 Tax=Pleurodeles waltl TaxID=8319 RepID=A0AAV7RV44_PLEWA|nr:hypothetical protein NDU88_008361 [Pleurodeles waltl]
MTHRGGRESFSKCYPLPAAHQVHLKEERHVDGGKRFLCKEAFETEERQRKEKLKKSSRSLWMRLALGPSSPLKSTDVTHEY